MTEAIEKVPLAERMRPKTLDDFVGLEALDKRIVQQIRSGKGRPPSLILWGPPGSGKTTLAKIIGKNFDCRFVELSATLSGVKEVRSVIEEAKQHSVPTLLFVDEIHRFNKGQQDSFLPHVESGVISLIGATTENPSFYLTGALLSRCRVVVLPLLAEGALAQISSHAANQLDFDLSKAGIERFVRVAGGDARRLINLIESFAQTRESSSNTADEKEVSEFLKEARALHYDRDGEDHYNIASAFIKSLRGSDPDAALYYGFRMLEGGEDPRFLIRRLVIFASEDIGNADPRALQIAISTLDAYQLVGLPEGHIPIAQCITYLATAPKSNRSYAAMHAAKRAVAEHGDAEVPMHLRNAPTKLMKGLGYGSDYIYPHDLDEGYAEGVRYLPNEVKGGFYEPSDRGYEKNIRERLEWLRRKS